MNETSLNLQLLPSQEYIEDLKHELSLQPTEIRFLTFHISAQEIMLALLPELNTMLESGRKVEILADGEFSTFNFSHKVWMILNNREEREKAEVMRVQTLAMFNDLETKGAVIRFNQKERPLIKKLLPVWKCDHRKIVTLKRNTGERVAYFGGVNLNDGKQNDFMVKTVDQELAEELHSVSSKFDPDLPEQNHKNTHANGRFVSLFDVGLPFRSIIMDSAKEMIENARNEITYIIHIPPELPMLLSLLKAERRGVKVQVIMPNEDDVHLASFPYNLAYSLGKVLLKIFRSKIEYKHLDKFTHSKVLIADKEVLIGSHNLSAITIWGGVKEYSAKIKDAELLSQLRKFIQTL